MLSSFVRVLSSAFIVLVLTACDAPVASVAETDGVPGSTRLAGLLGEDDRQAFAYALEPRPFEFPRDHGPHPEFRNEWWYVTGNLEDDAGRRFGYELTIFRFSLSPERLEADSGWRTDQIYIGHLAVSDPEGNRFLTDERYARGALGLAGAEADPFRVWLGDWQMAGRNASSEGPLNWRIEARDSDGNFSVELELESRKPAVLNGDRGLSQKSAEAGNASYYYSLTRALTKGSLQIDEERFEVSGASWLDREWSSSALSSEQTGWDWFALQLDDDSELMFYQLRKTDGSVDPLSAGTLTAPDGTTRKLAADEVSLSVLEYWDSPRGGRYPSRWRLQVPEESLDLEIVPVMPDQELSTTVRYWEGAVDVSGERKGNALDGRGYVELTGYAAD